MTSASSKVLRRYTNIPSLLHTLKTKTITLLDPSKWEDTNDSYWLDVYRKKRQLESVVALCFTQVDETYHHWHVFAEGAGGACIEFDKTRLLKLFDENGIKHRKIEYKRLPELKDNILSLEDLPFIKRYGFRHEGEFRAIFESPARKIDSLPMNFPIGAIRRISLSPWLPEPLLNATKEILRSVDGCEQLKVFRSTLTGNNTWKRAADKAE
jgi:hypothetical protein